MLPSIFNVPTLAATARIFILLLRYNVPTLQSDAFTPWELNDLFHVLQSNRLESFVKPCAKKCKHC
jgi:hypothetical protein